MLTVTGLAAFRLAEVHRRLRGDLALLHARTARLGAASPVRFGQVRRGVVELLDDVILPLAAVEDELVDLVHLERPTTPVAARVGRTEHDVVRELAAALREASQRSSAGATDSLIGAIHAVDDLLPAHIAGEEQELLADFATLAPDRRDRLRSAVDLLPAVPPGGRALARFHLPLSYAGSSERLDSPPTLSRLLPAEGLPVPSLGSWSDEERATMRVVTPVALVVGPDELALRCTLDALGPSGGETVAWIDGRLAGCVDGRSSVLELRATPPVHRLTSGAPTTSELRRVVGLLGGSMARHLVSQVRDATSPRPHYSLQSVRPDSEGRS